MQENNLLNFLENMRKSTEEEIKSVSNYIGNISQPTGVTFDNVNDGNNHYQTK